MSKNHGPIKPIQDQVVVRQDPPRNQRPSGLYIPEGHRESYEDIGTVLAVGPGRADASGSRVPLEVAVGDRVRFVRRAATALVPDWREGGDEDRKDVLVLRESDVVGVVTEES